MVLHHLAIVYTAAGAFYYVEPTLNDPLALAVLVATIIVFPIAISGGVINVQATGPGSLRSMRCGIRPLRWE
ncbi:MAG: hypothetical protein WCE82_10675 [Halobacteriota archaeon]